MILTSNSKGAFHSCSQGFVRCPVGLGRSIISPAGMISFKLYMYVYMLTYMYCRKFRQIVNTMTHEDIFSHSSWYQPSSIFASPPPHVPTQLACALHFPSLLHSLPQWLFLQLLTSECIFTSDLEEGASDDSRWCLSFWVWVTPLSMIFSSPIPNVKFTAEWYFMVCVYLHFHCQLYLLRLFPFSSCCEQRNTKHG